MRITLASAGPALDHSADNHFGMGNWPATEQAASPSESDVDPARALVFREDQIERLEQQKHETGQTIRGLETGRLLRESDRG